MRFGLADYMLAGGLGGVLRPLREDHPEAGRGDDTGAEDQPSHCLQAD